MAKELWLIRHGETAWSLSGAHTGSTDLPLTPLGEAKARALGTKLADSRFRPELGDKPSPFNGDAKPAARVPKSPADGLAWEDGHRAGQSMPLSRRLDAVRSRRARGAWLTGTIESIADTPSSTNEGQQQARGQAQDRLLR